MSGHRSNQKINDETLAANQQSHCTVCQPPLGRVPTVMICPYCGWTMSQTVATLLGLTGDEAIFAQLQDPAFRTFLVFFFCICFSRFGIYTVWFMQFLLHFEI